MTHRFPLRLSRRFRPRSSWRALAEKPSERATAVSERPRFISRTAISNRGSGLARRPLRLGLCRTGVALRRPETECRVFRALRWALPLR